MIGDRTILESTIGLVSPWVVHYSKELWGDNAHGFDSNRWFGSNATQLETYSVSARTSRNVDADLFRPHANHLQSSAGYGLCPGQSIAKIELTQTRAMLVRDCEIHQVDKDQDGQCKAYFTMVPTLGQPWLGSA